MEEEVQRTDSHFARNLGLALAFALLVCVIAVAYTTVALPGCAGCHFKVSGFEEQTSSTVHASAGTTCVDCHVASDHVLSRTKFGFYETYGMWVRFLDPTATDVTAVKDDRCLACHADVMDKTLEVRGLRIIHESCSAGRACVDCHSEVGHAAATSWSRIASMNDCTSCHRVQNISLECETCHTGKVEIERSSRPEFAVTHGPTWQQTHGMGQMGSCSVCHTEAKCGKCHGPGVPHAQNFILDHAEISQRDDAECLACHDNSFCYSCHLTDMPHPRTFVQSHSSTVNKDGDASCLRCHAESDCSTCHVKHVHPGGAVGNIPSPGRGD